MYEPAELWLFLPFGYLLTVLFEMPVLLVGLSPQHSWKQKVLSGFWLTACTYPMVVLVMPLVIQKYFGQFAYLAIAETFAPAAECLLFWLAFYHDRGSEQPPLTNVTLLRDMLTIVAANLVSFLVGGAALKLLSTQTT